MSYGKKKIDLLYEDLTYEIRGILFQIQNELGRFAREKQFADLLETKLIAKGWHYRREERIADTGNVTDFIIQDKVVIELKSKPFLLKTDYYQLQRYLHSAQIKLGILVNFREQYLKPKRVLLANQ